jgi:hypothetical protein
MSFPHHPLGYILRTQGNTSGLRHIIGYGREAMGTGKSIPESKPPSDHEGRLKMHRKVSDERSGNPHNGNNNLVDHSATLEARKNIECEK